MISCRPTAIYREQQRRGKIAERHAVATVPERKEMTWVPGVRADVRQAVGCDGKQSFPCVVGADLRERRVPRVEIRAHRRNPLAQRLRASSAVDNPRTVRSANEQPAI